MKFAYDIPDSFWSLFRSMNRELYMEALLKINEEYEYNNYYLSKEVCLQVLEDWNESQRIWLSPEEFESENDASQTPPNRILNWLIKTGWEVVLTPVTYAAVGWLKNREGVEVFDTGTEFSPFAKTDPV